MGVFKLGLKVAKPMKKQKNTAIERKCRVFATFRTRANVSNCACSCCYAKAMRCSDMPRNGTIVDKCGILSTFAIQRPHY